jgi:predicted nucleotidyltransferase
MKRKVSENKKDAYLEKVVALIVEHYTPERVYLFGSKARGDAGPDSDYDFLVVVSRKVSSSHKDKFIDKRWGAQLFAPTDVVIWTKKSFEELSQVRTSLPATVLEEGKLLYEAA